MLANFSFPFLPSGTQLDLETTLAAVFSLIVINLLLSGDNALVIGLAVRSLPPRQKRLAVLLGGAGALGLRIVLTSLVAILARIPLLQPVGGVVLVWITYRLLASGDETAGETTTVERSFWAAMQTIIIADLTMSTDNILAVGAAAHGNVGLLVLGLTLSMALIMVGGALISVLMVRMPWLIYIGGGILLFLAGDMIAHDPIIGPLLGNAEWTGWAISGLFALLIGGLLYHKRHPAPAPASAPPVAPRPSERERAELVTHHLDA